ncbi:MAG: DUF86 domain-containing protein [Candidatus Bipolaricaulota bacterium]
MKPSERTSEDYLQDILDYVGKAERFMASACDASALADDEKTLMAVVRALEVIGEAAKHIPQAFRAKHPAVPWRGMTGMRDKVVHAYFGVDAAVVWRTVKEDLPLVRETVQALVPRSGDSG